MILHSGPMRKKLPEVIHDFTKENVSVSFAKLISVANVSKRNDFIAILVVRLSNHNTFTSDAGHVRVPRERNAAVVRM